MKAKFEANLDIKRWTMYSTAGAAALLTGTSYAEGPICHVVVNQLVGTGESFAIEFPTDIFLTFAHDSAINLFDVFPAPAPNSFLEIISTPSTAYNYISNLASGVDLRDVGLGFNPFEGTLAYSNGPGSSQFLNQGGFIGFRFGANADAGDTSQLYHGWARLELDQGTPVNTYTLVDYAFAEPGQAIVVGQIQVPETSSLGLLALGACGLMAHRQRRPSKAA